MELDIAFMMEISGDKNGSDRFVKAAKARKKAFETVFWNEKAGQWLDYWLSSNGDVSYTILVPPIVFLMRKICERVCVFRSLRHGKLRTRTTMFLHLTLLQSGLIPLIQVKLYIYIFNYIHTCICCI